VPALDVIEVIAKPLTIERLLAAVSRCAA
jgi:hypothetical protein